MSVKSLLMFGSVFVAAVAFAQAPLGTVGNVQGLVTVTDGTTGGTVVSGSEIRDGMRFVTTTGASVTLNLNNCTVTLLPNHAVTVLQSMTCQELMLAAGGPGLGGGGGGSAGMGALGIGGLALAGFAVHKGLDKNPSLSGQ